MTSGVAVPLERYCQHVVLACGQFNEHVTRPRPCAAPRTLRGKDLYPARSLAFGYRPRAAPVTPLLAVAEGLHLGRAAGRLTIVPSEAFPREPAPAYRRAA